MADMTASVELGIAGMARSVQVREVIEGDSTFWYSQVDYSTN